MCRKAPRMMLHWLKSNGAAMAQLNLLHHWNFPRAGDGANPRAITPCTHGAAMAQRRLARASRFTRCAPAALCLRRRSQPHRWSPAERDFRRECQPGSHCIEADHAHVKAACDQCTNDLLSGTSVLISAIPGWLDRTSICRSSFSGVKINICIDQQSQSLFASSHTSIDISTVSRISPLSSRGWEWHGKLGRCRNAQSLAQPCKASTRKDPGGGGCAPENPRSPDMRPPRNLSRPALPNPCHRCARR